MIPKKCSVPLGHNVAAPICPGGIDREYGARDSGDVRGNLRGPMILQQGLSIVGDNSMGVLEGTDGLTRREVGGIL